MNTWSSSPDHPCASQHSSYQLQSWRANGDVSLILSNSSPDNPSTDDIIAIIECVCGYACKDSEPTAATSDLFEDMVNAVDAADADQVTGKSICAKMLIETVGRRDVSGPEASFELSGLALWRCSCHFTYLSMTGSRRLERDGDTATLSSLGISTLQDRKSSVAPGTNLYRRMARFQL